MKWLLRGLAVTCFFVGFWFVVHNWFVTGFALLLSALIVQGTVVAMGESAFTNRER